MTCLHTSNLKVTWYHILLSSPAIRAVLGELPNKTIYRVTSHINCIVAPWPGKCCLSHYTGPCRLVTVRPTADPEITSRSGLVPYFHGDWSWNNFYRHSPPSADSLRVVVSYKLKYVHEVLVNPLVKLAQEKVWLSEWPSWHAHSC